MRGRETRAVEGNRSQATRGRWWLPLVKLLLTVAVTWLILRGAGVRLAEVGRVDWTLVRPDAPYLALSVVLLLATYGIAAALWSRNLVEFGGRSVGVVEGAAILAVANLGRYVPGKVLALAGVAVLARRRGISGVRAAAAAVTAQMLSLLAAIAVGGWVALWSAGLSEPWRVGVGIALAGGLAGFLYFGGAGALLRWILRKSGHDEDLPDPSGRSLLRLLPGFILNWIVLGAAFVCLSRGLGIDLGFGVGITAFAAAYFAGYVMVFAPAGIGVRESSLVGLLTPVVGLEASVVLAALQRVWITAVELATAAVAALALRRPAATARAARSAEVADPDTRHPA